jgi:hypothetical protein
MINDVIKRLRKAADALEQLLDIYPESNSHAAKQIQKRVKPFSKTFTYKPIKFLGGVTKGYKYKKGTHWTQNPKNRAKMLKNINKGWKARVKQIKEQSKKV